MEKRGWLALGITRLEFDSIEHAQQFRTGYFPTKAANLNATFYTRVFDATAVEEASRQMHSPFSH